ncbi:MAG: hypothetical protein U0324_12290 [Polyangiales bacterium]
MVPWLPALVRGVLLPFGDRIVFDGLLMFQRVSFGPGIRARFDDLYRHVKKDIVARLGPPEIVLAPAGHAPTKPAKAASPKRGAKAKKKPAAPSKPLVRPGRCEGCGAVFSKRAIGRHLDGCLSLQQGGGAQQNVRHRLLVESPGMPEYWLVLEAGAATTLAELDALLRKVWLECCGHLSAFRIDGVEYTAGRDEEGWSRVPQRSLRAKVGDLTLAPSWRYEYDFGTTTELRIRPLGTRIGSGRGLRLLARNEAPTYPCLTCGEPATDICMECRWQDGGCYCAKCLKRHPCGEEMVLPLVNSPRTGECGYTG